ncbi:MAG: hypothetical protein WC727_12480 [Ignavibacteriaceae bacterium]|jgi:hypothetical protein
MPDDQNTTQNPISEENSIPASPQEPTEPTPINTTYSEPSVMPPEAPEASKDDFSVKSNDIPLPNPTPTEPENEPKTEEKQAQNEPAPEPVEAPKPSAESESIQADKETAQTTGNEPLAPEPEPIKSEPVSVPTPVIIPPKNSIRELLDKAKNAIQFRKRKKLDKVMAMFLKKSKVTNDEVEKFLHISDATATRYLSQLEKEGKIKQTGKTGHSVFYSKI